MEKVPLAVVAIAILVVGYIFLRSATSTIRFAFKMLTWVVIFAIVIGASWFYMKSRGLNLEMPEFIHSKRNKDVLY